MPNRIVCFVLCGGMGERLAPLSTPDIPKQFLPLFGHDSMLGETLSRLAARPSGETPIHPIASLADKALIDASVAGRLAGGSVLYEPMRRNTALAVAVAAAFTLESYGDDLMLVAPSDHQIETSAQFWSSVAAGERAASRGSLVLFGVRPTRPETGYGYVDAPGEAGANTAVQVRRFHEKPDRETARAYLAAGDHYWNAGLFLIRAGAARDRFLALRPDIWKAAEASLAAARRTGDGMVLARGPYSEAASIAFDRAIVERTDRIVVVPARFRWRDVGTWRSLVESVLGRW